MSRVRFPVFMSMLLIVASLYTTACCTHMIDTQLCTKTTQHSVYSLHVIHDIIDVLVYHDLHRSIMAQNLSGFLHGSGPDTAQWKTSSAVSRPKNATAHSRDEDDEDQILEESQWCTSHEDHNSQMHAIHGNTKSVTTKTTPKAAAKPPQAAKPPPTAKPPQTAKQPGKPRGRAATEAKHQAAADAAKLLAEQNLDGIVSHQCRIFNPGQAAEYTVGQILINTAPCHNILPTNHR